MGDLRKVDERWLSRCKLTRALKPTGTAARTTHPNMVVCLFSHTRDSQSGEKFENECCSAKEAVVGTMGGLRAAAATALAVAAFTAPASALYKEEAGLVDWYELGLAHPALTSTLNPCASVGLPRGLCEEREREK